MPKHTTSRRYIHGLKNNVLTTDERYHILHLYQFGLMTHGEIAKRFRISDAQLNDVLDGAGAKAGT